MTCTAYLPDHEHRRESGGAYCNQPAIAYGRCERHAWKRGDRETSSDSSSNPVLPPGLAWRMVPQSVRSCHPNAGRGTFCTIEVI